LLLKEFCGAIRTAGVDMILFRLFTQAKSTADIAFTEEIG